MRAAFFMCRLQMALLGSLGGNLAKDASEFRWADASNLIAQAFAVFAQKLDVWNSLHLELFGHLGVGLFIDIQIGPDKLVLHGFDLCAGINILLHALARRTPDG